MQLLKKSFFEAIQKVRLDNAAEEYDLPGAAIKITDSGVELLSSWQ
jgi:hypothetical protein